jgi:hypothetical protein
MKSLQNDASQTEPSAMSKIQEKSKEQSTPLITTKTEPSNQIQVDVAVFLAARLRELTVEAANLRIAVADLQGEIARLKANKAQIEIDNLDNTYNIKNNTTLQKRQDGTYWKSSH